VHSKCIQLFIQLNCINKFSNLSQILVEMLVKSI